MKNNWKKFRLENINLEIIDGDRGKNYPKNNELSEKGYCLFLNAKNIPNYKFDFSECQFISKEKDMLLNNGKLEYNDIVLTTRGTLGHFAYYNKNIVQQNVRINSGMVILRNRDVLLDTSYFLKFLNSCYFKNQIDNLRTGSAQPQIPIKDLKKIEISLPPLEIQRKIAKVLSAFDDKIELNNKMNENLEQQAQSIFKFFFIENKYDFIKNTKIGEICSCELGGTPNRNKSEYWNGNIPWINSGEVNKFRIIKPSEYITQLGLSKSATKLLPKKTTVLAITGATLGQISLLEIDSCANQSVVGIVPNEQLPYEFIYPYICHNIKEIMSHQTGGAQQHINKQNVETLSILLPKQEILNKYKNIVSPIFENIANNCFENERLIQLRDTLLPKLMNGEIDVDKIKF